MLTIIYLQIVTHYAYNIVYRYLLLYSPHYR